MAFTSMFDILYISLTLIFLLELYFTESHFIKAHSFSMWLTYSINNKRCLLIYFINDHYWPPEFHCGDSHLSQVIWG